MKYLRSCYLYSVMLSYGRKKACRFCSSLTTCFCSAACSPCAMLACVIALTAAVILAHVLLIYWNVKHGLRSEKEASRSSSIDAQLLREYDEDSEAEEDAAGESGRKQSLKELDSQLYSLVVQQSPNLEHNRRIVLARRVYSRSLRWLDQAQRMSASVRSRIGSRNETADSIETVRQTANAKSSSAARLAARYRYCPLIPPALHFEVDRVDHVHDTLRAHSFANVTASLLLLNQMLQRKEHVGGVFTPTAASDKHVDWLPTAERLPLNETQLNAWLAKIDPLHTLLREAAELASQMNHFGFPFWSSWLHRKVSDPFP